MLLPRLLRSPGNPCFVDIDPVTFNIDPEKLDKTIEALKGADNGCPLPNVEGLTPKGIISVDIFGLPADYEAIKAVADKHGLFLIEDAAQSFGGEYKGKRACSLGDITCTSFFPAKPLGCYGDGGMCFTDDDYLIERLRSHRVHGMGPDRYDNVRLGITGRLDSLQAAILLAKFEIFPEEVDLRDKVATTYAELLGDVDGLTVPSVPEDTAPYGLSIVRWRKTVNIANVFRRLWEKRTFLLLFTTPSPCICRLLSRILATTWVTARLVKMLQAVFSRSQCTPTLKGNSRNSSLILSGMPSRCLKHF